MRKYTTASLCVSAVEPQKPMIALAKNTNAILEMIAAITIKKDSGKQDLIRRVLLLFTPSPGN